MESVLVVNLDINDLRNAVIRKSLELLNKNGSGLHVGINIKDSDIFAGLILSNKDLQTAAIEYAQCSLEKRPTGPISVDFNIDSQGGTSSVVGASVNFKWGGKT